MENLTDIISLNDIFNITETGPHQLLEFKKGVSNVVILDPGANHTGFCKSGISRIDGKTGQLFYGNTPVDEIIKDLDFGQLAYRLITQQYSNSAEEATFCKQLNEHFQLDAGLRSVLDSLPGSMHPMDFLMAGVIALSGMEEQYLGNEPDRLAQAAFITARLFVIAAYYCVRLQGKSWKENVTDAPVYHQFLQQLHDDANVKTYAPLLNIVLMLHAEHGQNCSTATVRNIASAGGDIYTAIASGIAAFKGRLHGGASQYVSEMYDFLSRQKMGAAEYVTGKLNRKEVIYGFGHRIYRNWDPRARIMFNMLKSNDPVYNNVDPLRCMAFDLVDYVSKSEYFNSRYIFPNPDLFNNIFYTLFGMPSSMNTVMLSLGRVAGWLAHYHEHLADRYPIMRPQEIYK